MYTCYHPQTKFAKVMFSQVSVCPWGGVSVSVQGVGVSVPRGSLSSGVSVQGDLFPGGLCPGGFLSGRGSLSEEGSLSWRPPGTVMSGQYASYWNAFLLLDFSFYSLIIPDRDIPLVLTSSGGHRRGSTHPTGMHTCCLIFFVYSLIVFAPAFACCNRSLRFKCAKLK